MQLFYNSQLLKTDSNFIFDKEESKHIIKVLRKKENDILQITNGFGSLFTAKITLASDTKCAIKIIEVNCKKESKAKLHIAITPTKMNDRFEWFLEKATEIGIYEITPIFCDNSERKNINKDRFEKILIAAMKQSNTCFLPKLNEAISFKHFISTTINSQKFIAHCQELNKKSFKKSLKINDNAVLLIGPEGDFSSKEIELALQNDYVAVTLGNTRLRTETAGIIACHSFVFANEVVD